MKTLKRCSIQLVAVLGLLLLAACAASSPTMATEVVVAPTETSTSVPSTQLPVQTETPEPTATPILDAGSDDVPMVSVPAGNFIMGSTGEEIAHWEQMARPYASAYNDFARDEWPPVLVYLDTFEIDQYEVTQVKYQRCFMAGVCPPPYFWWNQGGSNTYESASSYNGTGPDLPVYVLRPGAEAYCHWVGKRLPTEAEWEKAARGTDGRVYPWGNEWDASKLQPADIPLPIGSYPAGASPYGALDMAGNAPEWVGNQYSVYPGGHYTETVYFIDSKLGFVRRGGYHGHVTSPPEAVARTANRFIGSNTTASGFRCLRGPAPLPLEKAVVSTMTITQPLPATNVDLSKMVEIPAGEFQMGSATSSSFPLHTIYLDRFYIDRYETTNAEYVEFLNALGKTFYACNGVTCADTSYGSGHTYPSHILETNGEFVVEAGYQSYPATAITWDGADAYCRWRGKRLPTDFEWEKAARGVSSLTFPWGDKWDPNKYARELSPIGNYQDDVSPYGVWDVLGNVEEWVSGWYDPEYYETLPLYNPVGPEMGTGTYENERITRSGNEAGLFARLVNDHTSVLQKGVRCAFAP